MSIFGGPRPSAQYVEVSATTRSPSTPAAPSGKDSNSVLWQSPQASPTPGDGLVIGGLFGIVVTIYPAEGQTLSGAGNLLGWVYNQPMQRWVRFPSLDIDLSDATSAPAFGVVFQNISRLGGLINWLADSVTISGGPYITVRLDGFTSTGPRGT